MRRLKLPFVCVLLAFILCMELEPNILATPSDKSTSDREEDKTEGTYVTVAKGKSKEGLMVTVASQPDLSLKKLSEVMITLDSSALKDAKVELKSFDAEMPEHRHGMMTKATKPVLQTEIDKKTKRYLIKGVKLHMPGYWLLHLKYTINNENKQLSLRYDLSL